MIKISKLSIYESRVYFCLSNTNITLYQAKMTSSAQQESVLSSLVAAVHAAFASELLTEQTN